MIGGAWSAVLNTSASDTLRILLICRLAAMILLRSYLVFTMACQSLLKTATCPFSRWSIECPISRALQTDRIRILPNVDRLAFSEKMRFFKYRVIMSERLNMPDVAPHRWSIGGVLTYHTSLPESKILWQRSTSS